jgi:hypothetical protein
MATKKSGRRGSAIIAAIAVMAALAGGPSAAAAHPGDLEAAIYANVPAFVPLPAEVPGLDASWVEE